MKTYISIAILFILPFLALSQEKDNSNNKRKARKERAKQQILNLHDGVLLVRLHTREKVVAKLKEKGNHKLAKEVKWKHIAHNKNIIFAFKEQFNFCPVYFFTSEYSENVKKGAFEKVVFVDKDLLPDDAIKLDPSWFLTAEFGPVQLDEEGHNMGFNALVMKDDQLVQLQKPFPFYVRTFDTIPTKKDLAKVVRKMNKRLHKFYKIKHK